MKVEAGADAGGKGAEPDPAGWATRWKVAFVRDGLLETTGWWKVLFPKS